MTEQRALARAADKTVTDAVTDTADLLGPLADHLADGLIPWWRCRHDGLSSLPAAAAESTCPDCDLERAEVGVSLATTVLRDLANLGLDTRGPLSAEQLCVHDWTDRGSPGDRWQECWLCGTIRDTPASDRPAGSEHVCDAGHFDRSVCACGWMHSYCTRCGTRAEPCAAD